MTHQFVRALIFLTSLIAAASPASVAHASAQDAVPYLEAHAHSPWSVMALSALGETPDAAFLQSATGTAAIELEAPILALTAAHQDPSTYPQSDLVLSLRSFYVDGQIGDPTTLNDDVFGILALVSAGASTAESIIADTRTFIESHQNADGGWPFIAGDASDTNTTAATVMALVASGSSASDAHIVQALTYLHAAQNQDGGFPYDPKSKWGTASDASSDAWVMLALAACGESESSWSNASGTPMTDLMSYQTPDGYFEYQHGSGEDAFTPVTTSYAVLALSGKTLPIAILPPQQQKPPPPPVTPLGTGGGGLFYTLVNQNPIHEGTVLGTSTESIASMTTPLAAETATSSKSSYLFTQNLQYGMSDDAVFKLQEKLIAHGMLSIIIPTGWFGPLTLKAVKIFQEQNEIPPTGFVGAMTRASLNAWK